MDRILMILTILMLSVSSVFAGVESAQYLQGGNIRVVMQDGRTLIVPDDMANRHRQLIAEWVGEGNAIIPADPSPVPTRQEKIRSDPDFPKPSEFMEAFIDCRFGSDCTAAQALRDRLVQLRNKYP